MYIAQNSPTKIILIFLNYSNWNHRIKISNSCKLHYGNFQHRRNFFLIKLNLSNFWRELHYLIISFDYNKKMKKYDLVQNKILIMK